MNPNYYYLASFALNVVWFIYAMLNTRWTRNRVRTVEYELFNSAPAIHAERLDHYFRKKRNQQGLMLVQAIYAQLQAKPTKKPRSQPELKDE